MTEALLDETARHAPQADEPTPDSIVAAVSTYYGYSRDQLFGDDRTDSALTNARAITFALIADHTPLTPKGIAEFAERDRVDALIRRVHKDAAEDPKLQDHMQALARAAAGEPLEDTVESWRSLVIDHYGLSHEEISTLRTPRALEARQVMAHLLLEKTVLPKEAVARQTGYNRAKQVGYAVNTLAERRSDDPALDERVEILETGQLPEVRITQEEIFERVSAYYGVPLEQITGPDVKEGPVRARYMALHLLVRELGYDFHEAGRTVGRESVQPHVLRLEERLARDPYLRRQRKDILEDPQVAERGPIGERMLQTVCDFYGVEAQEVAEGGTSFMAQRSRAVTAYILQRRFGLSSGEVHEMLGVIEGTAIKAAQRLELEIQENPLLADEVAYLNRPKRIKASVNERLLKRVAEATDISVETILESDEPTPIRARQMVMALMAERGHMSPVEIARTFGVVDESRTYRAVKVMGYHAANDPLLVQQMEYARTGVFSERTQTFTFDADAAASEALPLADTDALPMIAEDLVHPAIREEVYGIVRKVAAFYKVPALEIIGRTNDFDINRARRAAIYLCRKAKMPLEETALCFDARNAHVLGDVGKGAAQDIETHTFFAEEIKALRRGEQRRDVVAETMELAAELHDIAPAQLVADNGVRARRARFAFLSVMDEQAVTTYERLAPILEMDWHKVASMTHWARKRVVKDPRMRAEVDYLTDPTTAPKPPSLDSILSKVSEAFDIDKDSLTSPLESDDMRAAKSTAAYIIADEMGLPRREIADILGDTPRQVEGYIARIKQEVADSPRRALDIDRLKPPHAVSLSMATRIVRYVTRQYELDLTDISAVGRGQQVKKAQKMIVNLLRQAEYSVEEVSSMLGMPGKAVKELTNGLTVELSSIS